MAYEARKICNFILSDRSPSSREITNLRINKLLFLIHGWSLTRSRDGLVRNHFEAWSHGPVIRVVYREFKAFGERPILRMAEHLDYASGQKLPIDFDDITSEERVFIQTVVEYYEHHTTGELVDILHEMGGPWHKAMSVGKSTRNGNPLIPEELIREYFADYVGDNPRH